MMFTKTAEFYDAFYHWKDYAGEVERLDRIIRSRTPHARTLLDVACGTGRHLALLAEHYEVEGVDIDRALLAVARRRVPTVPLHRGDMRTLDLRHRFDVVTCLFSSIGYVRTPEALRDAVAAMARHVAAGGLLIVEPWIAPEDFDGNRLGGVINIEGTDFEAVRMDAMRVEASVSILELHYLIARPGLVEHIVEEHRLGLFRRDEMEDAFEAAGASVEYDSEGLMGRGLYIARVARDRLDQPATPTSD